LRIIMRHLPSALRNRLIGRAAAVLLGATLLVALPGHAALARAMNHADVAALYEPSAPHPPCKNGSCGQVSMCHRADARLIGLVPLPPRVPDHWPALAFPEHMLTAQAGSAAAPVTRLPLRLAREQTAYFWTKRLRL
jgi:hypothetical protein